MCSNYQQNINQSVPMSAMVPQRQIAATWKTLNIPDHLSYSSFAWRTHGKSFWQSFSGNLLMIGQGLQDWMENKFDLNERRRHWSFVSFSVSWLIHVFLCCIVTCWKFKQGLISLTCDLGKFICKMHNHIWL